MPHRRPALHPRRRLGRAILPVHSPRCESAVHSGKHVWFSLRPTVHFAGRYLRPCCQHHLLPAPDPRSKPVDDESYRVFLDLHTYEKSALDSRVERTDDSSPYWRRETVSFRAAYGNERVIAHLFLPRNVPAPYQVIAVMGGSTITDIRRFEDFDYPYEFILRSGRAVIIPAYSGTLERGPAPGILPANQERERALKWSMDLGRSIDYLETRPDIDTRKLGFYGISMGAGTVSG